MNQMNQCLMKIIVFMKQVANKDAILRINKDSTWIEESDISYEVNESDGYALEEALRLKEKHGGGEVIICSMGPQRVKAVIKDGLARGADRAIHVVVDNLTELSPYSAANILIGSRARRIGRPLADRFAIGRPRLRADGRDYGGAFGAAARDDCD